MTCGEKIKEARGKAGLSQEQLAEQLSVSRSTIAKWETDKGMPGVDNLKPLAQTLNITIDYLLDYEPGHEESMKQEGKQTEVQDYFADRIDELIGKCCYIELSGWNDGVWQAVILGQDRHFIFYSVNEEGKIKNGAIGKKYITSVKENEEEEAGITARITKKFLGQKTEKKTDTVQEQYKIDKSYFLGKTVDLEVACKEGFIRGFFDFTNDDYMDVIIKEFTDEKIVVNMDTGIEIDKITKIQEC